MTPHQKLARLKSMLDRDANSQGLEALAQKRAVRPEEGLKSSSEGAKALHGRRKLVEGQDDRVEGEIGRRVAGRGSRS